MHFGPVHTRARPCAETWQPLDCCGKCSGDTPDAVGEVVVEARCQLESPSTELVTDCVTVGHSCVPQFELLPQRGAGSVLADSTGTVTQERCHLSNHGRLINIDISRECFAPSR